MRTLIGITGATGIPFTLDFIKRLEGEKFFIVTKWGEELLRHEADMKTEDLKQWGKVFSNEDLTAPTASGSVAFDSLVILPCSAGTLNKISLGIADNLLTRTAMVTLKERRKLIVCLRETPVSTQTLRNATRLSEDGAVVMPLTPMFYHKPLTLEEVIKGYSMRVLQQLGQETESLWKEGLMSEMD